MNPAMPKKDYQASIRGYCISFPEDRFYALGGMPSDKIVRLLAAEQGISVDAMRVAMEKEHAFVQLLHLLDKLEPDVSPMFFLKPRGAWVLLYNVVWCMKTRIWESPKQRREDSVFVVSCKAFGDLINSPITHQRNPRSMRTYLSTISKGIYFADSSGFSLSGTLHRRLTGG